MERRRNYGRLTLISALLVTSTATGYWGWQKYSRKSAGLPIAGMPQDQQSPGGETPPPDQMLQAPAHWQPAVAEPIRRTGYDEPATNEPPTLTGPGIPENPAESNPYRGRRGGGYAAAMSDVPNDPLALTAPAVDEPPAENIPASPAAAAEYYPNNPTSEAPRPNVEPLRAIPQPMQLAPREDVAPPSSPRHNGGNAFARTAIRSASNEVVESAGLPGDRRLEGPQAPAVVIEKSAPAEIQVGKKAAFQIHVRNAGQTTANQVIVTDQVPRGTQLVETRPQAQVSRDGSIVWDLGQLSPGADATLEMVLLPEQEGQIGSTAQVTCQALATVRTVCTRPALVIDQVGPQQVLIGETVSFAITLTNPGTGPATGVVIEEDIPEGLTHAAGRELEYEIGTLKPGETKRVELTMIAAKAGVIENIITARGEGSLKSEHRCRVEIVAPQLQVGVTGPKRRYLDRQATYQVSLANPGTAAARNVDLAAFLPRGMKFVGADSEGQYDPTRHAVFWALEELPANKSGVVKVTTVPLEPGDHVLRVETRADRNLTSNGEQVVVVEAAPEILFSVVDLSDPIEVGSDTTYEVRVVNNGTRAASNVRISVAMPPEMRALGGNGPTKAAGDEQRVLFEPLGRLQPREEAIFKVNAQAVRAGDTRIRVQLTSDDEPTPVTKEESTRVYLDQ